MRLPVLGQMIKGAWTDAAIIEAMVAVLDRIKWLLWHGNAPNAIGDIECPAADFDGDLEKNATAVSKLASALASSRRASPTTWATS